MVTSHSSIKNAYICTVADVSKSFVFFADNPTPLITLTTILTNCVLILHSLKTRTKCVNITRIKKHLGNSNQIYIYRWTECCLDLFCCSCSYLWSLCTWSLLFVHSIFIDVSSSRILYLRLVVDAILLLFWSQCSLFSLWSLCFRLSLFLLSSIYLRLLLQCLVNCANKGKLRIWMNQRWSLRSKIPVWGHSAPAFITTSNYEFN